MNQVQYQAVYLSVVELKRPNHRMNLFAEIEGNTLYLNSYNNVFMLHPE